MIKRIAAVATLGEDGALGKWKRSMRWTMSSVIKAHHKSLDDVRRRCERRQWRTRKPRMHGNSCGSDTIDSTNAMTTHRTQQALQPTMRA